MTCWQYLELEPTSDKRTIKRAYAKKLKKTNPEDDPAGFQALREAYQDALEQADYISIDDTDNATTDDWIDFTSAAEVSESTNRTGTSNTEDDELLLDINYPLNNLNQTQTDSSKPKEQDSDRFRSTDQSLEDLSWQETAPRSDQNNQTLVDTGLRAKSEDDVERLLDSLFKLLDQEALQGACDSLRYIYANDEALVPLDARYEFEGRLLVRILEQRRFPLPFVGAAIELFQWQLYDNPFPDDDQFAWAFETVMTNFYQIEAQIYVLDTYTKHLSRHLKKSSEGEQIRHQVEDSFFSNFNEDQLARLSQSQAHREVAYHLLRTADAEDYPDNIHPVPMQTRAWWYSNVWDKYQQWPDNDKEDSGGFSFWRFILVVWVISFVLRSFFYFTEDEGRVNSPQAEKSFSDLIFEKTQPTRLDGYHEREFKDGARYEGYFENGFFHGQGTLTLPSGNSYTGEFKEGKKDGQGVYTWPNGNRYEGAFKDNVRHGQGTMYFENGFKLEGEFVDDQRIGIFTITHPDGYVETINYDNTPNQI